jgi:DnaK suppressor protein
MNKRDLVYFEKRLLQELKDLQGRDNCNFNGLHNPEESPADIIDRASDFIDRSLSQKICDRETLRIRMLEQSLDDLADGVYGICEECGEDIAIKRLKANPLARHCIECKTALETHERLTAN